MVGARDPKRALFDAIIPLPDGTTYNSYLLFGSEKIVLIDTVDPSMKDVLLANLSGIDRIDYVIANHAEQDHSGCLPIILEKYPMATVLCSELCKPMLLDLLPLPPERIRTVKDGEELFIGGKTLQFIMTPWVHWPETMSTYLKEDQILFSCDFFGSHYSTDELFVVDEAKVYAAAKRYYAEIMMPYRMHVKRNLEKIKGIPITMIAPSHGPIYQNPSFIIRAHEDWVSDAVKNEAILLYISMHGSTKEMMEHVAGKLREQGITVHMFDMEHADVGLLAMALVDAATLIVGSPAFLVSLHPSMSSALYLLNDLNPKTRFVGIIGSYGWGGTVAQDASQMIKRLHAEILTPILVKGAPKQADYALLETLALEIKKRHEHL